FEEQLNQYQFWLEGFDESWSEWTTETQKDYTNIPEGNYVFKVRAKNIFGNISPTDNYDFSIIPPWYRTWWAYLIYFALIMTAFFLFSKWRSAKLMKTNMALEEIIRKRTKEIRQKNLQLSEQTKKLEELDVQKAKFFANISHEFRTPLTLIKGPIDRLERNQDQELSRANVSLIRRNADRLLRLVNQLLDLSKFDSGNIELNYGEGNPMKLLKAIVSSFSSLAAQNEIDFRIETEPQQSWASFDKDKLEQIVYNLLSNAFKFTPKNGSIFFFASHSENELFIEVRDTGTGIPEDKLPYIFNRFYQVDDTDSSEMPGTGIGLAVTKELVELMQGKVTVDSQPKHGSSFKVVLPLDKIHNGSVDEEQIHKPEESWAIEEDESQIPNGNTAPTVLMVEDNADMRDLIKQDLLGTYNIMEAKNGKEGLALALREAPDLIISDLMMPKMGGLELCNALKTNIVTSHIPIIMLTAKAGIQNKLQGLETGADDYLTKPFNSKELGIRVRNLIESRQKLRELFTTDVKIDPKRVTVTSMDEKFVHEVKELLESKHQDPQFNVPEMQTALAMGKTQLYRKIKSLTGQSPGEVLRYFRLKRAAQLILESDEDFSQIAYSVGFNSLSYFSRRFKDFYGSTPSDYKQKNKTAGRSTN
ncbi:MAG: ATP-binding protein, partial [Bacteroidota bacterium]